MRQSLGNILKLIVIVMLTASCSTHSKPILLGGIVGATVGAGLGYTVVHHGKNREYIVPNTIVTSAAFALVTMGVLAYHYRELDQQKIEITSKMSRSWLMNNPQGSREFLNFPEGNFSPRTSDIGGQSLRLDDQTRWGYPTFRKRELRPEVSSDELVSERHVWEILRPGFFVSRELNPAYFVNDNIEPHPFRGDEP